VVFDRTASHQKTVSFAFAGADRVNDIGYVARRKLFQNFVAALAYFLKTLGFNVMPG
jgi:hypothetical protein